MLTDGRPKHCRTNAHIDGHPVCCHIRDAVLMRLPHEDKAEQSSAEHVLSGAVHCARQHANGEKTITTRRGPWENKGTDERAITSTQLR